MMRRYDSVAVGLHWLSVVLVTGLILSGLGIEEMTEAEKSARMVWHAGFGGLALIVIVTRLGWRLTHPPPPPEPMAGWEARAALALHRAFYVVLIVIPLAGIATALFADYAIRPFALVDIGGAAGADAFVKARAQNVHGFLSDLLLVLIALHVLAALNHQFRRRNNLLARMWFGDRAQG